MSKGLKINNDKSTVSTPKGTPSMEEFKQLATAAADRLEGYKKRSWDLGVKFKGLMESSILPENKSIILKDLESETLGQLSQLATDINTDSGQPEGAGSVAVCQLIMKMMIIDKDRLNQTRFKAEQTEALLSEALKEIDSLKKTVEKLSAKHDSSNE